MDRYHAWETVQGGDVLVDLVRFELTTSSMPWKRAPNCATGPCEGFCSNYITGGFVTMIE